jgi:DNA primase
MGFKAAVEWLQDLAGGRRSDYRPTTSSPARQTGIPDQGARAVYAELYLNTFELGDEIPAGKYLRKRRLDPQLAHKVGANQIGNSRDVWDLLLRKFGIDLLRSAGLVSRSDEFLLARHRLLFFYLDDGWPVYVQGRDITGEAKCKELSLAGLRSPVPFNADLLRTPRNRVYVCEGCIDTLSALQMGFAAVGVPGVLGFRQEWFGLFQGIEHVVIFFDNDEAGQRQAAELRAQFRLHNIRADAYHPVSVNDMNDLLMQGQKEGLQ